MDKLQQLRDKLATGFGIVGLRQAEEKAERAARASHNRNGKEHPAAIAAEARHRVVSKEVQAAVRAERETREEIARLSAPKATPEEIAALETRIEAKHAEVDDALSDLLTKTQKTINGVRDLEYTIVEQAGAFQEILMLAETGHVASWDIKALQDKIAALKRRGVDD